MKTKASVNLILDPVSKADKKVLKLQVTFNRKSDRRSLGGRVKISKEEYQKKNKAYKEAVEEIRPKLQKAQNIIDELGENFTWESFRTAWKDEAWGKKKIAGKYTNRTIKELYDEYFNRENKTFSPDTKDIYYILVQWIEQFKPNTKLHDITVDYLQKLTKYIKAQSFQRRNKETTDTTIAIYMRGLRAVYNFAIDRGYIDKAKYPFGKNKYKLACKKSANIALTEEEFQLFINATPENYKEKLGYNFFFLSYALDGLNLADIIRIKNRDITTDNKLIVGRWKIRNTLTDEEIQEKQLMDIALYVLKEYGTIDPSQPNKYVLRFLDGVEDEDIEQQDIKKKNLNKNINKGIKSICERIGIKPFSLYSARHTYATHGINNGIPIEVMSKNLLHTNIITTQGYIDSISNSNQQKNIKLKEEKLQLFNKQTE